MAEKFFTAKGPGFYEVKDILFDQYVSPRFDAETGLSPDELQKTFDEIAARDGQMSRMELRAELFCHVLEHAQIFVDPQDWFADHFYNGDLMMSRHRETWRTQFGKGILKDAQDTIDRGKAAGAFMGELDLGHISPGWRFLLKEGIGGILRQVRNYAKRDDLDDRQRIFYASVEKMYVAFSAFILRLRAQAVKMGAMHPEFADRMEKLSACLENISENAPQNFYEALQLTYLFHQLIEFEGERVRSMGSFALNFSHFYEKDLADGTLTDEDARELLRFFWHKFFSYTRGKDNGKNFYFGGLTGPETDSVFPISYMAMEVFYEINTPDPKLSILFNHKTPDDFARLVAKCLRDGRTNMVIVNDEIALEAVRKRGVPFDESFNYLLIGCYEPAIEGQEAACNMSIKVNLAKAVELALHDGTDPVTGQFIGVHTGKAEDFADFESFYQAYVAQLAKQIADIQDSIRAYERHWEEINPSAFIAGTFPPCLEKGRDISQSGPKYNNTGCMGAGLGTAADSLMAIKQMVFDEKRLSMAQLKEILADDFKGHAAEQLYALNRVHKWGNNQADVDEIAVRIQQDYTSRVTGVPNARGGIFTASMFSLDHNFHLGKNTGALPDGRNAGRYISKGLGAYTGMDKNGVTGQILSVGKLDFTQIPNGSVLDIYLHPTAVDGEKGIDTLLSIIRAYFAQGGYGIQFNILNVEDLKRAQKHPEEYATLQVRVCGWNVYFVTLSPQLQNHFIETTMQVM